MQRESTSVEEEKVYDDLVEAIVVWPTEQQKQRIGEYRIKLTVNWLNDKSPTRFGESEGKLNLELQNEKDPTNPVERFWIVNCLIKIILVTSETVILGCWN